MKNIILALIFTVPVSLLSQHSIGLELGYNMLNGALLSGEPAPFFAIPYEYSWDENTSCILKPSFSQNRDYFIGTDGYDVYDFRTRLNFVRLSFSLERKFGNPKSKFFGSYRIGLGFGLITGGHYLQSAANSLSPISTSENYTRKNIDQSEINLINLEFFTEYGLGVGYRFDKNWSVMLLRNTLISLVDLDNFGEPIFEPLKQYRFSENIRYRSFITGINFKIVYHFSSKEGQ